MRHQVRTKFDPDRDFTPRRQMTVSGAVFYPGEPFDKGILTPRRLRQFFDSRKLVYLDGPVAGGRMKEGETEKTHRGAHAARATQNANRHAAHFAELDKKRAAAKAEAEANAKAPKRKRNSPETIRGLKPTATPAAAPARKAKPAKAAKAPAPKKVEKAETKPIDTKGEEFKARMEAARAAAAARRAAAEAAASAAEKPKDAAPPPPPPADAPAAPAPAQDAPAATGKPLKTLTKPEKVKDPAAIAAARAAIVIPDDWASLDFNTLSGLAAQLTDTPVKSKAIAIQVISEEIKRRGTS